MKQIISKFAHKYEVKVYSSANVGNHLHLHIKLSNRFTYYKFIRAITAAIAMAVTGASRWQPLRKTESQKSNRQIKDRFWDYRPFTRVVVGFRGFLNLKDYIEINQMEGFGYDHQRAIFFLKWNELKRYKNSG